MTQASYYRDGRPAYQNVFALAASNTVDLVRRPRGILVSTAGVFKYAGPDGSPETVTLPQGVYDISPVRLYATGLTAVVFGLD